MIRLSAAVTRRVLVAAAGAEAATGAGAPSFNVRGVCAVCACVAEERGGSSIELLRELLARGDGDEGLTSSSQVNINNYPMCEL